MSTLVKFQLNGRQITYSGDPDQSLLSWLREEMGFVSVKDGCSGQGFCRACTVEIDGRARLACVTKMRALTDSSVTTIEGFPEKVREILASAFVRHGAVQCGFCSPGFLARARILLHQNQRPTREQVVAALRHNFCRCTGYLAIVDAVLEASVSLSEGGDGGLPDEAHDALGERPSGTPKTTALADGTQGLGVSIPKYQAYAKALGAEPFVDDLRFDGMLHGVLRFSDHPRARVISIETRKAEETPGVASVLTAADVPGERLTGLIRKDWPLMVAEGEITRCVGDVLALVVAETEAGAREAAAAIEVEYEVLAPLTDPADALSSDVLVDSGGNLLSESVVKRGGDVEEALRASAHIVRGTYRTQRVEHAFLETEAAVALPWTPTEDAPEGSGSTRYVAGVELFAGSQGTYVDRSQVASLLGVPPRSVKVNQISPGGAFGGKEDLSVQGHAALAALVLGRPVKVRLSRPESIRMHPKRHPMVMEYELGCDERGILTALKARIIGDTGAYASVGAKILDRAASHAAGPYQVPVVDVVARAVYTNNLPCGAMRGFGVNQVTFAMESSLDDLCEQGGFDRWRIRYDNAIVDGGMTTTGQILEAGVGLRQTLLAVKDAYESAPYAGLACGIKNCGVGRRALDFCEVEVEVGASGRVLIKHGWTEMGQGVNTMAQQFLAEETGIPPEMVDVVVCTEDEAEAGMTTSSRGTSLIGNALIAAARDLKRDLEENLDDLSRLSGRRYRGQVSYELPPPVGTEGAVVSHYSFSYATQLVILNEEGRIEKVVAAHDVGRVINPVLFRGQIVGSVHMGLGYALSEDLPQEGAGLPSTRMRDLGLVPMNEMPMVDVIGVEVPDPLGPHGAKGVGEVGVVPTAAAVALAYRSFDGRRRLELPIGRLAFDTR